MQDAVTSTPGRSRSDLAADCLAHDLNNVFQTILEAADLIETDPRWAPVADMIARSVEQGRRIVKSIVDAERAAPLEEIIGSAAEFANDYAAATTGPSLRFSRDIPPGLRCLGRAWMIERALVNLFVNSVQAARSAGASTCAIRVRAETQDGGVLITVSDDGPGFRPEVLPSIFTPRFTTKDGSAGLGLHIVQRAILDSGGSVKARNGEQGGAVFEIVLPAVRGASKAAGAYAAETESMQFGC